MAQTPGTSKRQQLAKKGHALPDGSFPIQDKADLQKAISAFGLGKNSSAAKAHIIKRAKELGAMDMLPSNWGVVKHSDEVEDFLTHHGILGMHWGSHKSGSSKSASPARVTKIAARKNVKESPKHAVGKAKAQKVLKVSKEVKYAKVHNTAPKKSNTLSDAEANKQVTQFLKTQNSGSVHSQVKNAMKDAEFERGISKLAGGKSSRASTHSKVSNSMSDAEALSQLNAFLRM